MAETLLDVAQSHGSACALEAIYDSLLMILTVNN